MPNAILADERLGSPSVDFQITLMYEFENLVIEFLTEFSISNILYVSILEDYCIKQETKVSTLRIARVNFSDNTF